MLSITLDYDVPASRDVAIRLQETIKPGKHKLIVVIDEADSSSSRSHCKHFRAQFQSLLALMRLHYNVIGETSGNELRFRYKYSHLLIQRTISRSDPRW